MTKPGRTAGGAHPNQDYKRSPAQLRNIAEQKKGGRFVRPRITRGPSYSWWAVTTDAEFIVNRDVELPRMLCADQTTFVYKDEGA